MSYALIVFSLGGYFVITIYHVWFWTIPLSGIAGGVALLLDPLIKWKKTFISLGTIVTSALSSFFITHPKRTIDEWIKTVVKSIIRFLLGFLVGATIGASIGYILASLLKALILISPSSLGYSELYAFVNFIPLFTTSIGGLLGGALLFHPPNKWKGIIILSGVIITLDLACFLSIFFLESYKGNSIYLDKKGNVSFTRDIIHIPIAQRTIPKQKKLNIINRRNMQPQFTGSSFSNMTANALPDSQRQAFFALKALRAQVRFNDNYEVVDVSLFYNKQITDTDLVHLKGLTTIEHLSISDTQITDAGLVHLKHLTNLKHLWLGPHKSRITDKGLEHLKGMTKLKSLSFNNSAQITDVGAEHLKALRNLERLQIIQTGITDTGLQHLTGLKKLRRLELQYKGPNAHITVDGVKKFKKALPNCVIKIHVKNLPEFRYRWFITYSTRLLIPFL